MIYLSAGHYVRAPGASWRGFVEHDEALSWVWNMLPFIPQAEIVPPAELSKKIRWINARAEPGDLALEVHFNAGPQNAGRGCEALFAPGSRAGEAAAESLFAAMSPHFPPPRGVKPGWYRADPEEGPLAFLSETRCVSVIIEPEFVYHAAEIRAKRAACIRSLVQALRGSIYDR